MGLFDFLFSRKGRKADAPPPPRLRELKIDLRDFQVGATHLGAALAPEDFFSEELQKAGKYGANEWGMALSLKEGLLEDVLFFLEHFPGNFTLGDTKLNLTTATTEKELLEIFGEPYWTDRDENETILFYEYQGGSIEIQFEIPNSQGLAVIIMVAGGLLADSENRKSYGVTKPWPPE